MIVAVTLSSGALAALLGAAVGSLGSWGLAWVTDIFRARRERRVAALLVLTELTSIGAALSALRRLGVATPPLPKFSRPLWEANGTALLYRADLIRAGRIARAYSAAADIAAICEEPGRDFTQGSDADLADTVHEEVLGALREVMRLAGLPKEEVDHRMREVRKMHEKN
jgi:hypothetical protein